MDYYGELHAYLPAEPVDKLVCDDVGWPSISSLTEGARRPFERPQADEYRFSMNARTPPFVTNKARCSPEAISAPAFVRS